MDTLAGLQKAWQVTLFFLTTGLKMSEVEKLTRQVNVKPPKSDNFGNISFEKMNKQYKKENHELKILAAEWRFE